MIVSVEYEHDGKRFAAHANLPEIPEGATIISAERTVWVAADDGLGDDLLSSMTALDDALERMKS